MHTYTHTHTHTPTHTKALQVWVSKQPFLSVNMTALIYLNSQRLLFALGATLSLSLSLSLSATAPSVNQQYDKVKSMSN